MYKEDFLRDGYENLVLNLHDDYEGKVIANLIRKKPKKPSKKAVLYVHGFLDYFFNEQLGNKFINHGYNFYALDLRKYGRSILPHQTKYFAKDLNEYFEEIDLAIKQIQLEGNTQIVVGAHSMGSIIACLYADKKANHNKIDGLFLNSPYFDANLTGLTKKFVFWFVQTVGKKFPYCYFPSVASKFYHQSIHKVLDGEWIFNIKWKEPDFKLVRCGWVRALILGQKKIQQDLNIKCPILIMTSMVSSKPKKYNELAQCTDIILDIEEIKKYSKKLGKDLDLISIPGGLHDLFLSKKEVREIIYNNLFNWLKNKKL